MSSKGILEVGKICHYCHQVDFLPFKCEGCEYEFCASHRFQHECEQEMKQTADNLKEPSSAGKSSKISEIDRLFQEAKQPKSYEIQRLNRERYEKINNERLIKKKDGTFDTLGNSKDFINSQLKFLKNSLFSGTPNSAKKVPKKPVAKKASKIVEVSRIRNDKELKGDPKIQNADRIYVWAYVIPNDKTSMNDTSTGSAPKTVKFEKKAVFISKNWPVGKAVDSVAALFKVKNENSKTSEYRHKLNLFKSVENSEDPESVFELNGETAQYLKPSSRVLKMIQNGDTLHLVRGVNVSHLV